jgi:hypothetical protein
MLCAYELLKQVSAVLNGMEQHINLVELIRKTHEGTFRWEQKSRTFTTQCPFCDFDKISLSIRPQAFKCYACGAGGGVTEWMWHLVADRGFRNAWKEAKDGQDASE